MSDPTAPDPGVILLLVRCEEVSSDIHPMMFIFVEENEDGSFLGTISLGEKNHFGPIAGTQLGPARRLQDLARLAKIKGDTFLAENAHLWRNDHK